MDDPLFRGHYHRWPLDIAVHGAMGSRLMRSMIMKLNSSYYSVKTLLSYRLLSKNLKIKIYKTIILPVVIYGRETWSPTLRQEFWLRLFENKILRWIFGHKKDEKGDWRSLHNEKFHSLYYSRNTGRWLNLKDWDG